MARLFLALGLFLLAAGAVAAEPGGYTLGAGDSLRVTVFGEPDLSGAFEVGAAGHVSLPLIGPVPVADRTPREAERAIRRAFLDGYLKDPVVSIEVLSYRPFTVLGEVREPGRYPYEAGMTVLTAVALGGGFTYRADEDDIVILRGGNPAAETRAGAGSRVLPGDVVRIGERFF